MAFWGQHKCGSMWLNTITGALCKKAGIRYRKFSHPGEFGHDLPKYVADHGLECVSWVNAEWNVVKDLDFRGFHVVRDPRDLLVSAYFSHLKTHPTEAWPQLAEFRPFLERATMEDGLFMEFGFIPDTFRRLREWQLDDPRVLQLRLEDVSPDPVNALREAYRFIGLFDRGLTEADFLAVMDRHRFESVSGGRKPGEEDRNSHFRKGIAGDWKNHLTERHVRYFKTALNDVLLKYGYEQDDRW